VRQGRLTSALGRSDLRADFATATASGFATIPAGTYVARAAVHIVYGRIGDAGLHRLRSALYGS
jgi:hypothetical protein